jgi:hypothetical protein
MRQVAPGEPGSRRGSQDGLTIPVFPAEPEALSVLKAGAVQLGIGISPSTSTAIQYGAAFGHPVFYDSQRIMRFTHYPYCSLTGTTWPSGCHWRLARHDAERVIHADTPGPPAGTPARHNKPEAR